MFHNSAVVSPPESTAESLTRQGLPVTLTGRNCALYLGKHQLCAWEMDSALASAVQELLEHSGLCVPIFQTAEDPDRWMVIGRGDRIPTRDEKDLFYGHVVVRFAGILRLPELGGSGWRVTPTQDKPYPSVAEMVGVIRRSVPIATGPKRPSPA